MTLATVDDAASPARMKTAHSTSSKPEMVNAMGALRKILAAMSVGRLIGYLDPMLGQLEPQVVVL